MSVTLTPLAPQLSVGNAEDPYKKYWLAILGGFGLTAVWLLVPTMDTQIGSTHVSVGGPATDSSAEQSLDSPYNPNGAPGGALDLSMGAAKKTGADAFSPSMLYQPPDAAGGVKDGALAGRAAGSASGSASASLAQQLKAVARKDASGWGGEKAVRGFTMPHLSGNGLSGLGAASGGFSASASVGGVGAFGAHNAQVGSAATQGLHDDGGGPLAGNGGLSALKHADKASQAAARSLSADAAASQLNRLFDGSKGRSNSIGPGGQALGGAYAAMDTSAPKNLKLGDPAIDAKKLKAPPATPVPTSSNNNAAMVQMGLTMVGTIVGGVVGGPAGMAIMMAASQAGQMYSQQQQQQQQQSQQQQQYMQNLNNSIVR